MVKRKKKKPKRVVKHPEPDPADMGLDKGPPAATSLAEAEGGSAPTEPDPSPAVEEPVTAESRELGDASADQRDDEPPKHSVGDSDEFRNVWGGQQ